MRKSVIAVDIDDVLSANAEGWVAYSNKRWGTKLKPEDYTEHWSLMWGTDHEETERRAVEFHKAKVVGKYRHFDEAKPVLEALARKYSLVVTTSRRRDLMDETTEWISMYFEGIFDEIHYAGMWDKVTDASAQATKAELCKLIGADYLIDDQLKHCLAADIVGIKAILFGNYSWNQADSLPAGVTRCVDWQAVAGYFDV